MPYGVEEWPRFPDYKSLNPSNQEIRLLRLHPDPASEDIALSLVHRHLNENGEPFEAQPYYALSYVWGNATETKPVYVNGYEVQIRSSLRNALYHLRKRMQDPTLIRASLWSAFYQLRTQLRNDTANVIKAPISVPRIPKDAFYLWVDCLCINQEDVKERNTQILLMGQIFRSAEAVFGWLGASDADLDVAMATLVDEAATGAIAKFASDPETFAYVSAPGIKTPLAEWDTKFMPALQHLSSQDYWRRIWILQEFALSRQFWVCQGEGMLKWSDYKALVFQPRNITQVFEKDKSVIRQPMGRAFLQVERVAEHRVSLKDLTRITQSFGCTDPRDRVYGLMQLLEAPRRQSIMVDYKKHFFQVNLEACEMDAVSSLDFFDTMCSLCNIGRVNSIQHHIREHGWPPQPVEMAARIHGHISNL